MGTMSRRNFIEGTAFAGVAASLAGVAAGNAAPRAAHADEAAPAVHAWDAKPAPITDVTETKDYDIIIVGSGVSGMAAAEAAAANGAKVVVIEKASQATWHGVDNGNVGSKVQKEAGVEIDPREAARLLYQWSQQTVNYDLLYTWASRSGVVFDHLAELAEAQGFRMIQADGSSGTAKFGWDAFPEQWKVLQTAASFVGEDGVSTNANLAVILQTAAESSGAEFVFDTNAQQLVGDASSGITGVIAQTEDGAYVQYNATKGVILATGDIGSNDDMMQQFCPMALRADANAYTPVGCNTGDGILMGVWAGAAMALAEPAPMIHQFMFDTELGEWTYDFPYNSFYMSWLNVNREGKRFAADAPYEPFLTNARMTTSGNAAWSIFDADYVTYLKKQMPDTWETIYPGWSDYAFEHFAGTPFLLQADTLEGLAEQLGIDAETFLATVERYNAMYDAGVDEDFGVPEQLLTRVQTAPFYATPSLCSRLVVPFGLHVDANSQVLTADDEPIAGLFAVGNVQGDFFALSYPVHCPGVSQGRALTFGNLVGDALSRDTVITKTA